MAGVFPPESQGGVPPGAGVANGYSPAIPVTGEGPLYVANDCTTALTADQMNGIASEIVAVPDRLGFSYMSGKITNMADALVARLSAKIERTGDTMTGPLFLSPHPIVQPLQAVTKSYVDGNDGAIISAIESSYQAADAALQADINNRVLRSGDTMSGNLRLALDPVHPLDAATKQYVDSHAGGGGEGGGIAEAPYDDFTYGRLNSTWTQVLPTSGGIMTGPISLPAAQPTSPNEAAHKGYVDSQVAISTSNVDAKVAKAGDTMTGPLLLSGNPTLALHPTTKGYVDTADTALAANISTLNTSVNGKVAKAGDIMTGPLVLPGNPVNALEAAPKQYVDVVSSGLNARVAKAGDQMTGFLTLNAPPTNPLHAATKAYVDGKALGDAPADGLIYGRKDLAWVVVTGGGGAGDYVPITGGTMTGPLTLSAAPVNTLHAATKAYADQKIARSGDTMTGALVLNANPTVALGAAPKQYVDAIDTAKVSKGGDSMSGPLTLPGAPTINLHAATKQYVDGSTGGLQTQIDNKVAKAGDAMTGSLTLSGPPTVANHAATKAYVDAQPASSGFTTGDAKLTWKIVADPGWLMMNDQTIGKATSTATFANDAALALYSLFFTNINDNNAPLYLNGVMQSRSAYANPAQAFNLNVVMYLPKVLGRALCGASFGGFNGSGMSPHALAAYGGAESETPTNYNMHYHGHTAAAASVASGSDWAAAIGAGASFYTSYTGQGYAFNIVQPSTFLNVMVKL